MTVLSVSDGEPRRLERGLGAAEPSASSFRVGSRKPRLLPASSFDFVDRSFDEFTETHELILLR